MQHAEADRSDQEPREAAPGVDELVAELRRRVEERYRSGEYPPELEPELAQHFEEVRSRRRPVDARLAALLRAVEEASDFQPGRISTGSRLPLGGHVHRLIATLTRRQTAGVLRQVQAYADALHELVLELIESLPADRAAAAGAPDPAGGRRAFLEVFRGPRAEVLARWRPLLRHLEGGGPVLDLACGRGEMLELLRDRGLECAGFEADEDLVGECLRAGLPVERGDGLERLETRSDGSLGGLFAAQLVEGLAPARLPALLALAARRLRPGGRLVIEALDPASLWTLGHLSHLEGRPVAADHLAVLARQAGFARVEVEAGPAGPAGAADRLESLPADGLGPGAREAYNRNVERLNRSLFGPRTYALVATR